MEEYISKVDAVNAAERANGNATWAERDDCKRRLEQLKPADVVKVVRCKDCKHHAYDEIFLCYWCEYPGRVRETTPDGFCEKGKE